jgi:putative hydrolase of the HAD superfamily
VSGRPDDCETCRVHTPGGRPPLPDADPSGWASRKRQSVRRAASMRAADAGLSRPAVLLLDMGGVVIPTLFESVALPNWPKGPLVEEELYARVEAGELDERHYWMRHAAMRGDDVDIASLWRACSYVRDELRSAMTRLVGRVRIVAFTNDMRHWFGNDWERKFPEMALFDAIVEARQIGPAKPHPDAYRLAANAIGERPERCLFVDDLPVNIDGARAVGMPARYFDPRNPAKSMQQVLSDLGLADEPSVARRTFAVPTRGSL